ncbi:hypothetical protein BaRGS_00019338, partial [Batillaria attramentaria]
QHSNTQATLNPATQQLLNKLVFRCLIQTVETTQHRLLSHWKTPRASHGRDDLQDTAARREEPGASGIGHRPRMAPRIVRGNFHHT